MSKAIWALRDTATLTRRGLVFPAGLVAWRRPTGRARRQHRARSPAPARAKESISQRTVGPAFWKHWSATRTIKLWTVELEAVGWDIKAAASPARRPLPPAS